MPIYAYRCSACGHSQDVLQKISDTPLSLCPACGRTEFAKQVTAAGFQLKGSGWYVTDFRGNSKATPTATDTATPEATTATQDTASTATPSTTSPSTNTASSSTPTSTSATSNAS